MSPDRRSGSVEIEIVYRPSAGFERLAVTLEGDGRTIHAAGCPTLFSALPLWIDAGAATARVTLEPGQPLDLVLAARAVSGQWPLDRVAEMIATTEAFWQ